MSREQVTAAWAEELHALDKLPQIIRTYALESRYLALKQRAASMAEALNRCSYVPKAEEGAVWLKVKWTSFLETDAPLDVEYHEDEGVIAVYANGIDISALYLAADKGTRSSLTERAVNAFEAAQLLGKQDQAERRAEAVADERRAA